ncbi:MAG: sugar phosphate isomerase/epimerase family protein [Thermoguttaceae bacterium]
MPSRRHFLHLAGAATTLQWIAGRGMAQTASTAPAAAVKEKFELGVASFTFHKFKLDQAVAMTRLVGLKHFCVHPILLPTTSTPEQIAAAAKLIKDAGLDLYACGVVVMPTEKDVHQAFEFAKAAGIGMIVGVPAYKLLPLVDEKIREYNIRVAIHNHGPGDKNYPTPDVAYEKIKDLDPRFGLCLDIGHVVRVGLDPSRFAEQCADRLLDVHFKDETEATAQGKCIAAGRGVIDLPKFLRTLKQIGYAGKVSFEYDQKGTDPMVGLAESVGYVRGVLAVL